MISRRVALATLALLVGVLRLEAQAQNEALFHANAGLVVAPTTVTDARNQLVHGLGRSDFRLYDNDVQQEVAVDDERMPISLVVALHASLDARKPLWEFRRAASLFGPLVVGQGGRLP